MEQSKSSSKVRIEPSNNRINLAFSGVITKKQLENIYTDVRFGLADLQPGFSVITDFTGCRFMYLNGISVFKRIFNYILGKESGEIVRIIQPQRTIAKQLINFTLRRQGYKPNYASTLEEAEKLLEQTSRREGIRFQLHEQPVDVIVNGQSGNGHILNISTSGCAIYSASSRPGQGDEIRIKFTFAIGSKAESFDLKTYVVRTDDYSFAVQFSDLDRKQKCLLWACLVEVADKEIPVS